MGKGKVTEILAYRCEFCLETEIRLLYINISLDSSNQPNLLSVSLTVYSIALSQYFERVFIIGMDVRTALIDSVYNKSLKMSMAAKKISTVGEVVNLMSVDVQRFMDLIPYLNMLW
jgi:hypothetical protein